MGGERKEGREVVVLGYIQYGVAMTTIFSESSTA